MYNRVVEAVSELSGKGIVTASGIVDLLNIEAVELKSDGRVFPFVKDYILNQGVKIPKHAHESVIEDFEQIFGERKESNTFTVKSIRNVSIDVDDWKDEANKIVNTAFHGNKVDDLENSYEEGV